MTLRIVDILTLISELNQHANVIFRNVMRNIAVILSRFCTKISLMHGRSLQRRHLSRLTEEQLEDIGVTREQAKRESKKQFWK